jgi:hypothetical protein
LNLLIPTGGGENMATQRQPTWKPLKRITVSTYETWLKKMNYDPYLYDPVLQSMDWVENLTQAIKKVRPVIGRGEAIEYQFWESLSSWEFILNSLSIARATATFVLIDNKSGWMTSLQRLRAWVDGLVSDPRFIPFFTSGTDFFWDMVQFFGNGREFPNPNKLAQKVLNLKT